MSRNRVQSVIAVAAAAFTGLSFLVASPADAGLDYRVRARIRTGTPLEGKGEYRERLRGTTLIQKWNVEVNFGTPNTSYEVQLNGSPVGVIVTNALGHAEQEFRTAVIDNNPHDEEPPIPTDFPHINAGDTLTIVGLGTASFVLR